MMVCTIDDCPRCRKKHEDLPYRLLQRASESYTHWTKCPETGEPVMLQFTQPPKDLENYRILANWITNAVFFWRNNGPS